jgi:hypothetical protein
LSSFSLSNYTFTFQFHQFFIFLKNRPFCRFSSFCFFCFGHCTSHGHPTKMPLNCLQMPYYFHGLYLAILFDSYLPIHSTNTFFYLLFLLLLTNVLFPVPLAYISSPILYLVPLLTSSLPFCLSISHLSLHSSITKTRILFSLAPCSLCHWYYLFVVLCLFFFFRSLFYYKFCLFSALNCFFPPILAFSKSLNKFLSPKNPIPLTFFLYFLCPGF